MTRPLFRSHGGFSHKVAAFLSSNRGAQCRCRPAGECDGGARAPGRIQKGKPAHKPVERRRMGGKPILKSLTQVSADQMQSLINEMAFLRSEIRKTRESKIELHRGIIAQKHSTWDR